MVGKNQSSTKYACETCVSHIGIPNLAEHAATLLFNSVELIYVDYQSRCGLSCKREKADSNSDQYV